MTPGVKLKYAAGLGQYGLNFPASDYVDEGVRLIRTTDLAGGSLASEVTGIYVPQDAVDDTDRLSPGDLLLSRSGTIGRAYLAPKAADGMAFAGFLVRFRPGPDADGRFLFYCTQSAEFQAVVERDAISSTIQNFNADRYNNLEVPLPGLDEQRAIADYLDRETARVDTLIEEQRRLIETLRERRLGVVRAGVTGLLSGGSRGSTDAWFGALPDDWTSARIRHDFTVVLGKMINAGKVPLEDAVVAPYLAAGSIQPEVLVLDDSKRMTFSRTELASLDLREGDVVVVEGGAGYGRSHYLRRDLVGWGFQNHVARLRPSTGRVDGLFATYCLKACLASGYIEANNRTATLPSLSRDVLGSIQIPVPPMVEQRRVAKYLDEQTAKIDELISETERFIELSRERRAALITAAVTGQIDVREVA